MKHRTLTAAAAGLLAAATLAPLPTAPAVAGDNRPGKPVENEEIGFRFRPLDEWAQIPPGTDPNDPKIGGYYSDKGKFTGMGIRPECEVYAFKRKRSEGVVSGEGGEAPADEDSGPKSAEELRESFLDQYRKKSTLEVAEARRKRCYEMSEQMFGRMKEKDVKKIKGRTWQADPTTKEFKVKNARGEGTLWIAHTPIPTTAGTVLDGWQVAGWAENDDFEIGVVYWIPGDEWKKYAKGCMASCSSIEFLDREDIDAARHAAAEELAGSGSEQDRWLTVIKQKLTDGWAYVQTDNYLLLYDKEVERDRVALVARQIEAIREQIYEDLFPPDAPFDDISVVRVCKDKDQYHQYGGPGGSAGYWNSMAKELVFYEDRSAKKDALRVLNHEAFHQYIFYSVGSISPHDWFNEGHGDYFSGHDYEGGRFKPERFSWRQGIIKNAIATGTYVPLKDFVRMTHRQYYGPQIGQNYAQGWSFIWFLRETRNPAWKDVLPTYFDTLKGEVTTYMKKARADRKKQQEELGDKFDLGDDIDVPPSVEQAAREAAIEAAFGDWDDDTWKRFEAEWKNFKY